MVIFWLLFTTDQKTPSVLKFFLWTVIKIGGYQANPRVVIGIFLVSQCSCDTKKLPLAIQCVSLHLVSKLGQHNP